MGWRMEADENLTFYNRNLWYYNDSWENDYTAEYNYTYIYICVPVISFCILSVAVNLVILSSLYWIRRPISPTLHISMSLAVSDLYTLVLDSLGLTFNSLLPVGLAIRERPLGDCPLLLLEALRIGGKLTTLGHLLALAGNHYLGIRKPLHYPSLMTYRNICCLCSILWMTPAVSLVTYFHLLEDDGFSVPECTTE